VQDVPTSAITFPISPST